jgi:FkbM family methyltransferase
MVTFPEDFESIVQESYEAILKEGDIAIDVGAHLGRHVIPLARRVGSTGHVFAFEPLPMCRQALADRLAEEYPELAPRVTLSGDALSDREGDAEFVVARDALSFSGLKRQQYAEPTNLEALRVRVTKLDALFADLPRLDYIKLDAEGGEYDILQGAVACLQKYRPVVGFEFQPLALREYSVTHADMARFWSEHRYKLYGISGQLLSAKAFAESPVTLRICDYVAIPAEKPHLEETLVQLLRRARVNWLGVRAGFREAEKNGGLDELPGLTRFPWPVRSLVRQVARAVVGLARFIIRRQMSLNHSVLVSLHCLADGTREMERKLAEQEKRITDLERLVHRLAETRIQDAEIDHKAA